MPTLGGGEEVSDADESDGDSEECQCGESTGDEAAMGGVRLPVDQAVVLPDATRVLRRLTLLANILSLSSSLGSSKTTAALILTARILASFRSDLGFFRDTSRFPGFENGETCLRTGVDRISVGSSEILSLYMYLGCLSALEEMFM